MKEDATLYEGGTETHKIVHTHQCKGDERAELYCSIRCHCSFAVWVRFSNSTLARTVTSTDAIMKDQTKHLYVREKGKKVIVQ